MKAVLVPMYFQSGMDEAYKKQWGVLNSLLAYSAKILGPGTLVADIPKEADGVLFLQPVVDAYRQYKVILDIELPIPLTV